MFGKKVVFYIVIVTTLYLSVVNLFTDSRWIGTLYDPSYPYLFNGIDWVNGLDVFLWGHPGAFVHWIHYMFLSIYSVFSENATAEYLVSQAESLLLAIGYVNIFLFTIVLISCIHILQKKYEFKELLVFIVFTTSTININEIISNTPETFLVLVAPLFTALLLYCAKDEKYSVLPVIGLGLSAAVLFSTKYTVVFLLLSPFLFLKPKALLYYIFSALFGCIVLFIPIYSKVHESIVWVIRLITQPGFGYGIETTSVTKGLDYYLSFFLKSLLFDKLWFVQFVLLGGLLLVDFKSIWSRINKVQLIGVLVLIGISIFVMVYKEMFRYFVPNKYLMIIVFIHALNSSQKITVLTAKHFKSIALAFFLIGLTYLSYSQFKQIQRFNELKAFSNQVEKIVNQPNVAVIRMFTSSSPTFARFFGSYYSHGNYITSQHDYYLMYFTGNYYASFNAWNLLDYTKSTVNIQELFAKNYDKVFLIGRISAKKTPNWSDNSLVRFNKIISKDGEYLFELTLK